MNIQIRYCSEEFNRAMTRYWGSEFHLNTNAVNLKNMDGPNTNWEILELIEALHDEEEYPPLECIGSCGLHIGSVALHSDVKAADWPIEKFLWTMFKILQDSPSKSRISFHVSYRFMA